MIKPCKDGFTRVFKVQTIETVFPPDQVQLVKRSGRGQAGKRGRYPASEGEDSATGKRTKADSQHLSPQIDSGNNTPQGPSHQTQAFNHGPRGRTTQPERPQRQLTQLGAMMHGMSTGNSDLAGGPSQRQARRTLQLSPLGAAMNRMTVGTGSAGGLSHPGANQGGTDRGAARPSVQRQRQAGTPGQHNSAPRPLGMPDGMAAQLGYGGPPQNPFGLGLPALKLPAEYGSPQRSVGSAISRARSNPKTPNHEQQYPAIPPLQIPEFSAGSETPPGHSRYHRDLPSKPLFQ